MAERIGTIYRVAALIARYEVVELDGVFRVRNGETDELTPQDYRDRETASEAAVLSAACDIDALYDGGR